MTNAYIFSYFKEVEIGSDSQIQNHLVIYFPYKNNYEQKEDVQQQLREYFYRNVLPDKLIIICLDYNKTDILELFKEGSDIYDYIPKFTYDHNQGQICILALDKHGSFTAVAGLLPEESEISDIYNRGLIKIFLNNGGLIVAQPAHHFVFPSGKHSNRFLRPGNVLVHGTETLFIASALVRYFKREKFTHLYCDTSSINSLAYAYIGLLKDLNQNFLDTVHIESFGSYRLFEQQKFKAKRGTIFLISSSTSGSILKRMTTVENLANNIELKNIAIIYGLNVKSPYTHQVICDLSLNKYNNESLESFESYNVNKETCAFCENGSKPLKVEGDVFLLEKPIVTSHLIKRTDLPAHIQKFSAYYKKKDKNDEPLVRCYYKDNGFGNKKYEIYIDVITALREWDKRAESPQYEQIFVKLEKYILQNIPASLKYMLVLPDASSQQLAKIIQTVINDHGFNFEDKNILSIDPSGLKQIDSKQKGTIAVISSCIVSGRNLLYLSRALREYEKEYQRIYFSLINRTGNKTQHDFLQSNLGLGEFGVDTHKIFNVETIFCKNEAQDSPWHFEEDEIKKFQDFFDIRTEFLKASEYCNERIVELSNSGRQKGLGNNLFFPNLKNKPLALRTGFAFAPSATGKAHNDFISHSKQSEIYFIISSILNDLRNKGTLFQTEYVRNIVDPGNFVRYNDGVIQSSFLRAATAEELNFSLSEDASVKMKSILGDMILHLRDDHAEALNEFMYAIAIRKMRLLPGCLRECIDLLERQKNYLSQDSILKGLVAYIKEKVLIEEDVEKKFKQIAKVSGEEV